VRAGRVTLVCDRLYRYDTALIPVTLASRPICGRALAPRRALPNPGGDKGDRLKTRLFGVVLLTVISASVANADPIPPITGLPGGGFFTPVIPPLSLPPGPTFSDLAPGSLYHLVFLTAQGHDALSTDIADYDAFVTAQANLSSELAALSTTWSVIGSTETVDAIDHVGVVGPVYNLVGQQVSAGLADMFDSGVNAPIVYDQYGNYHPGRTYVWSGTNASTGRAAFGQQYLGGRRHTSLRHASRNPTESNSASPIKEDPSSASRT
jgi:hypothetical protein